MKNKPRFRIVRCSDRYFPQFLVKIWIFSYYSYFTQPDSLLPNQIHKPSLVYFDSAEIAINWLKKWLGLTDSEQVGYKEEYWD